jgi:hypothetical protein
MFEGVLMDDDRTKSRNNLNRWVDRVVRTHTANALKLTGFASSSASLHALPEIVDEETRHEAQQRVDAALEAVLYAREIPRAEDALLATFAARAALALAGAPVTSARQLRAVVEALHAGASVV